MSRRTLSSFAAGVGQTLAGPVTVVVNKSLKH